MKNYIPKIIAASVLTATFTLYSNITSFASDLTDSYKGFKYEQSAPCNKVLGTMGGNDVCYVFGNGGPYEKCVLIDFDNDGKIEGAVGLDNRLPPSSKGNKTHPDTIRFDKATVEELVEMYEPQIPKK